jgi:hypothetical protein
MAGNWRGGSAGGRCFDVRDSTADQLYRPGSKLPTQRHVAAVSSSWSISVRKADGRFFPTQYNNGDGYSRCGTGLTGHTLRQVGATSCAAAGYSAQRILRLYYGPGARIVTTPAPAPPAPGDIGVLMSRDAIGPSDEPTTDAVVLSSDGKRIQRNSRQALSFSLGNALGQAMGAFTGDGRPDLAILTTTRAGPAITVFPASGDGLAPGVAWWQGRALAEELASARVELISGRWGQDGHVDLGLVVQSRDGGRPTKLYELSVGPDGTRSATLTWEGDPGGIVRAAYGGDVTGDRHTDITLVVDAGAQGTVLDVLVGGSAGTVGALQRWATDGDLAAEATLVAADVNGDGKGDVVAVEPSGTFGLRFIGYLATGRRFDRVDLGQLDSGYALPDIRVGVSDLDGDSLDDLYALIPDGDGATVEAFLSRGRSLKPVAWGAAADIDVANATTY